jgi:DNA ligase-associated metallophosphoesterase
VISARRIHDDPPQLAIAGHAFEVTAEGALHDPHARMLVVSDLHLEKGSRHAARGFFLPPYDTGATLARLARAVIALAPRTVVCLGDSFDDDGGPGRMLSEHRAALGALQRGRDWVWVSGNHDPAPPAGLGGDCAAELAIGALTFRHVPGVGERVGEIAGHLHPVAVVRGRGSAVRRRCVASDGRRAILPAFGVYSGGLDLRHRAFAGLFDRRGLVAFALGTDRVWPVPAARFLD